MSEDESDVTPRGYPGSSRIGQPPERALKRLLEKRASPKRRRGGALFTGDTGDAIRALARQSRRTARAHRMSAYLKALAETGQRKLARELAGDLHMNTVNAWRRQNIDNFALRERDAMVESTNLLADLAVQRAQQGSDVLLMFLLNNRSPEFEHPTAKAARERAGDGAADPRRVAEEIYKVWKRMEDYAPPAPNEIIDVEAEVVN